MKKIEFKIHINAPKQKVWETMLNTETYKEWAGASWPGSFYEGAWKEGGNIKFISKDGSGTLVEIEEFKPYHYIASKHIAVLLKGGEEDRDSDLAKEWIGTLENYLFGEVNGETDLSIDITTNPDWEKMFNDGYPGALKKLKEICEQAQ